MFSYQWLPLLKYYTYFLHFLVFYNNILEYRYKRATTTDPRRKIYHPTSGRSTVSIAQNSFASLDPKQFGSSYSYPT